VQIEEHADGDKRRLDEFDFHGAALDDVFADYREMHARCPVGQSSKYGGFTFIAKLEDIFAAEQDPGTFAVAPSMLLPVMVMPGPVGGSDRSAASGSSPRCRGRRAARSPLGPECACGSGGERVVVTWVRGRPFCWGGEKNLRWLASHFEIAFGTRAERRG